MSKSSNDAADNGTKKGKERGVREGRGGRERGKRRGKEGEEHERRRGGGKGIGTKERRREERK